MPLFKKALLISAFDTEGDQALRFISHSGFASKVYFSFTPGFSLVHKVKLRQKTVSTVFRSFAAETVKTVPI